MQTVGARSGAVFMLRKLGLSAIADYTGAAPGAVRLDRSRQKICHLKRVRARAAARRMREQEFNVTACGLCRGQVLTEITPEREAQSRADFRHSRGTQLDKPPAQPIPRNGNRIV
jgi:hypothetical protein